MLSQRSLRSITSAGLRSNLRSSKIVPASGDHHEGKQGPSQKVFAVLETIVNARRPLTVSELVVLMDVPKPTMHRIVRQLDNDGFLVREPQSRGYGPGPRLLKFAVSIAQMSLRSAPRRAVLARLSARTGETCNFGMIIHDAVVYLDRIESSWPLGLRFEPGSRVPLHCTSMGKLLLAYQPKHRREQLIGGSPLYRYTKNTITDPKKLEAEFAAIRKRGYSIDDQEFLDGVICLAVPVRDARGQVCAAVAISAPMARMSIANAERWLPDMRKAVEDLEALFHEGE